MLRLPLILGLLLGSPLLLCGQESQSRDLAVAYRLERHPTRAWIHVTASCLADADGSIELEWPTRRHDEPRMRRFRGDQIRNIRAFAGPKGRRLKIESGGPRWFVQARPLERVTFEWDAPPNSVAPRMAPAKSLDQGFLFDASEVLLRVTHLAEHPHAMSFRPPFDIDLDARKAAYTFAHHRDLADFRFPCGWQSGGSVGESGDRGALRVITNGDVDPEKLAKFHAGLKLLRDAAGPVNFFSEDKLDRNLIIIDSKRRGMRGPFILFTPLAQLAENPNSALRLLAREMFLGTRRRKVLAELGGLPGVRAQRALWFTEGISVYLGDLASMRANLINRAQFIQSLKSLADRELKAPGTYAVSGEELGRALTDHRGAAEGPSAPARGALLCFCLDTLLRDEKGEGGLTVHRKLWPQLAEGEVPNSLAPALQQRLRRFFARHIRGSAFPPIEAAFARYGLRYRRQLIRSDMGFGWARRDQGIVVTDPKTFPGLKAGDFVLEINDREDYDIAKILSGSAKKRKLRLLIARGKQTSRATAGLQDRRRWLTELAMDTKATPAMHRRRAAWLRRP